MKCYEYKLVQYYENFDDVSHKLTDLGLAGWRIKKVVPSSNPAYLHCGAVFMEREIAMQEPANEQKDVKTVLSDLGLSVA